jgi:hypothetical protein
MAKSTPEVTRFRRPRPGGSGTSTSDALGHLNQRGSGTLGRRRCRTRGRSRRDRGLAGTVIGRLPGECYFEPLVSQPGRGEPTPVTSSQPLRTFSDESSLKVRTEYSSPPEAFSPFA